MFGRGAQVSEAGLKMFACWLPRVAVAELRFPPATNSLPSPSAECPPQNMSPRPTGVTSNVSPVPTAISVLDLHFHTKHFFALGLLLGNSASAGSISTRVLV